MWTLGWIFLVVTPLLCAAPWSWRDAKGRVRTGAELKAILEGHGKMTASERATLLQENRGYGERVTVRLGLEQADLSNAPLIRAPLAFVDLRSTKLIGAYLYDAELSGANLRGADLSKARLGGTDLSDTLLGESDLTGALYEPKGSPRPNEIAHAHGLGYLTWARDSGPIYALRKSLSEAGFGDAARQVTAAINRHERSGKLERLMFDWTCEWGSNWLRPLELMWGLALISTFVYWAGMHFGSRSGLYLTATGERIRTSGGKERVFRLRIHEERPVVASNQLELDFMPGCGPGTPLYFRKVLGREAKALRTAFLFSLMSIFSLGFREFDFGRWIRMMQSRDYDIRARGWMRTVSGIQSLLGVALVALSLISYFGKPFE